MNKILTKSLHVFLYLVFTCSFLNLNGQWNDSVNYHNFNVNRNDTANDIADPYNFFNGKNRSDSFYDSLATIANRKNWSRELHRLIIRSTQPDSVQNYGFDRAKSFSNYNKKYIRNINIQQLEVFGPSMTDTARKPNHWLENTGNSLHVQTNIRFIENNLFFSEGEQVDPYILADNERILRNISSIQDVRIYIHAIDNSPDSVDIVIVTKDVMPFGVSWTIFDVAYGEASIWNNNLLGLGHMLNYTAYYNLNREPKFGYRIGYKINNISNSFASLEVQHTKRHDLLENSIKISRDFITPATRFGGGFEYSKINKQFTLETIDTTIPNVTTDYEFYDGWFGYSHPVISKSNNKLRQNYFISSRAQLYNNFERPFASESYFYEFYSRNTYLASIGYTWQGYHSTRLVYGFGNTEDLPYGAMIKLTGGYEDNEFGSRQYYGTTLTASKCVDKFGYLSGTIELGGFYRDKVEQGTATVDLLHITPLFGSDRHHFRNIITANFTQGINRFEDEFTLIEDEDGIRGIANNLLKGDKRFYANNEFVYYSPHYIYGFRFVYFAYVDAGMINSNNSTLINNPIYVGAGIGVRIRNERLVFNTIQLRFSFFPLAPGISEGNKEYINFTSYPQYRMPEFAIRKPEIISF